MRRQAEFAEGVGDLGGKGGGKLMWEMGRYGGGGGDGETVEGVGDAKAGMGVEGARWGGYDMGGNGREAGNGAPRTLLLALSAKTISACRLCDLRRPAAASVAARKMAAWRWVGERICGGRLVSGGRGFWWGGKGICEGWKWWT